MELGEDEEPLCVCGHQEDEHDDDGVCAAEDDGPCPCEEYEPEGDTPVE